MENNQFKPKSGRVYQYKGNRYFCVTNDNRFKLHGKWYNGVLYEKYGGIPDNPNQHQMFTRLREDFMANFIPAVIEPGDFIVAESMGRILGIYEVQETQFNSDMYARNVNGDDDNYLMFTDADVSETCQVKVKDAGDIEYLRNNTLFFLISEEYKDKLILEKAMYDENTKLYQVVEKVQGLSDRGKVRMVTKMINDFLKEETKKDKEAL